MSARNVVEVFTNKSTDFMLEYGGSASWVLSQQSAAALDYCVCSRNDERPREDDPGPRPEARNEAFLVGKVSGIELVENQNGRDRYLIRFSEYAEVSVTSFRPATTRNPVMYSDEASCLERGLDIKALSFRPMPEPTKTYERMRSRVDRMPAARSGLSIADAKEGLSAHYGVPIEAIQIIITG